MHPYLREYFRRLRLLSWNEREQRLRAFVRVYIFLMGYTIIFISIPVLVAPTGDGLLRSAVLRILLVGCTGILVIGAATYLDKRPVQNYGLAIDRRWLTDVFVGGVIGGGIPVGAVLLGIAGGWITVDGIEFSFTAPFVRDLGLAIIITMCIAVVEELVFRGYVLTNAIEGLDLRRISEPATIATAWCLSSFLFAITHPAPTLLNGLHFLSAGLLLGLAYLVSGQLGLPIGIHAGFNFVSAYGVPTVSDPAVSVISLSSNGPAWLTGQTGLIQTGLLLPAALMVIGYLWWRSGHTGVNPEIKAKLKKR